MKKNMKKILPIMLIMLFIAMTTTVAQASEIIGTLSTQGGVNPAVPAGVTTSNPNQGDTGITISWNSVAFIGGYNLYRIKDGASAMFVASTTSANYSDTGLSNGKYSYQLESYLGTLVSEKSTPTVPVTIDTTTPTGNIGGNTDNGGYTPSTTAPTTEQADFNDNGSVDILDFNILITNWGSTDATKATGDANNDEKVDIFDFNILITNWSA